MVESDHKSSNIDVNDAMEISIISICLISIL